MKYPEVVKYCLSLSGAQQREEAVTSGHAFTFNVGETPFAWFETGAPIQWKFSLRVTRDLYEQMHHPPKTRQVDKPGGLWLMITRVETFEDELLKRLIDWSYQQAVGAEQSQSVES